MHYKTTFLKQVILRFDYARLAVLQTDQETGFTRDVKEHYPEVYATQATQFQFIGSPMGANVSSLNAGWVRTHKATDANRSVTLAPDFLAIEYDKSYENFEALRGQVSLVLRSFQTHLAPVPFTRIGLRYVNEFTFPEGDALDWQGLLHPDLITAVKAGTFEGLRMTRSVHQLIAMRDEVAVTLNYGISNPDFPSPVVRRQFILDLDCYVSGVTEFNEAEQRVREVNALAEDVYEHAILDGLREKMGVLKDDRVK